jgi:hypothetical protein
MQEMRGGRKSELKTSRAEQTGLYSPGRQTLPKRASSDTIGPQPSKTAQKATAGRNGVHSTTKSNTYRTKAGPHGTIRVHGTRTKQTKSTRRSPANPAIRHQRRSKKARRRRTDRLPPSYQYPHTHHPDITEAAQNPEEQMSGPKPAYTD